MAALYKGSGKAVNVTGPMIQADMASHLDMTDVAFRKHVSNGVLPEGERDGRTVRYDSQATRIAYIRHLRATITGTTDGEAKATGAGSLVAERARLASEQANKQARENALADGIVVSINDVIEAAALSDLALKQRLEALGVRLCHELATVTDAADCKDIIDLAVNDALNAAWGKGNEGDDGEAEEAAEA